MAVIYKRELRSYFHSMIGYVFIAMAVALEGIYFYSVNVRAGNSSYSLALANISVVFSLIIPILTMRSFADERRNKTDQLFLTYPVSVFSVVMGKFLSMMTMIAIPLVISCFFPLVIGLYGSALYLSDYSSILIFWLLTGVFISIGMFISSLTENQIVAAVLTFAALLGIHLWMPLVSAIPATPSASLIGLFGILVLALLIIYVMTKHGLLTGLVGIVGAAIILIAYIANPDSFNGLLTNALSALACIPILYNFCNYHVFDLGGLFLYLSISAVFIYLTVQSIQKRRWS